MRTRIIKFVIAVILTPIALVLLATVALYIPPIQQWAVNTACAYASDETGMDVSINKVHLVFPIDLSLEGVRCTQRNDSLPQVTDTIAQVGKVIVDVELRPLFDGNVNINAIELNQAHINTADFVHECRVKGYVGRIMINNSSDDVNAKASKSTKKHVASVALNSSVAKVGRVILDDAHLNLELSDTVPKDTTKSENKWKIYVKNLAISNSSVMIHLPGDTMKVAVTLKDVKAKDGFFDLGKEVYNISHLAINKSAVNYDNGLDRLSNRNFATRLKSGLDANHIAISNINLSVDSIHYQAPDTLKKRASDISCLIRHASLKEQSGIVLRTLRAAVKIDANALRVDGTLTTPSSSMALNLKMSPNAIDSLDLDNGKISAKIDASISKQDLVTFSQGSMPETMLNAWPMYPLTIKGEIQGNMNEISVPWLTVTLPTTFALDVKGKVLGITEFQNVSKFQNVSRRFSAQMHADLKTYNLAFVKTMLDKSTRKMINIPSVHAIADLTANGPEYNITLKASEQRATINANARINVASKNYTANVKARNFNVGHFVKGYNRFNNVNADLTARNGNVNGSVTMRNSLVNGQMAVNGFVNAKKANLSMTADLNNADMYKLKVTGTPLTITLSGKLDVATDMNQYFKVKGNVNNIAFQDTARTYHPEDITVDILTRKDTTAASIMCGDFALNLHSRGGYKWLLGCTTRMQKVLTRHYHERTINQDDIRRALPDMTLTLKSGQKNPFRRMIKYLDIDYSYIYLAMKTSREDGIFADLALDSLATQGYCLDKITANISSTNDPKEIFYQSHIENRPPNQYVFDAYLDGKVLPHGFSVNTKLLDDKHELALLLGAEATMEEKGIRLHLTPEHPVLGYEKFALNDNNYVLLAHNNRIHADVGLLGSYGAGLKIYCTDEVEADANVDADVEGNTDTDISSNNYLQDLTLSINKLDLGRITASLPYMPKIEGKLNGDFHVLQNEDETFTLSTDMLVNNMSYEGCKVGDIGSQFTYFPKTDGSHYVDGIITLDNREVGSINGSYNMNTKAVDATLKFDKFPMEIANGFVPQQLIGLEGTAEGNLTVQGTTEQPIVNGELYLEDAALLSVPYGVRMRFDNDPVTITDSKLLLENFQMYAPNNEPLVIYGTIDFADLNKINLDMRMKAQNFQLINAKENLRSEAYGKVFVNAFALMKGDLDHLQMRGKLEVLPSTDVYYILRDSPITTDNTMKELVTFTDLSDTTNIKVSRPPVNGMNMMMNVVVDQGARVKAWLDASHNNYLDIIGNGDLRLTYANDEMRLTGRYTISQGEMKYSLPVIPLKTFTIQEGSYLEWTGELMNPKLNITALETIKSSVYINNVNQMVTFNTGVKLSKTLDNMGLEFLIESPENKDIADQLSMRSTEERGKLAVTLLTTGMYFSDGNTSSFSMNSAMNSFLQSQINNIAGSALKTVDLSFGMESSTEEDGTRHNDYTFKFAKRFWNNRLSISVGGKISSGPDVTGQNKSFFNNVELQYRLTSTSNKYLQMFYKRDVYDYLEGYLSQFGAGYLWKKNSQTFKELFHNEKNNQQSSPLRPDSINNKQ